MTWWGGAIFRYSLFSLEKSLDEVVIMDGSYYAFDEACPIMSMIWFTWAASLTIAAFCVLPGPLPKYIPLERFLLSAAADRS